MELGADNLQKRIPIIKMVSWSVNSRVKIAVWSLLWVLLCSAEAINPVLDLKNTFPYLINQTNGQVIEPRDYMDFENIYTPNDTYKRETTAPRKLYHLLKGFDFANYFQTDHWHYSNKQDLLDSALPVANATLCEFHLNWLEEKLNKSSESLFGPGEQKIKLMNLVDAFGKPEAGTYYGRNQWLGSFEQCKQVSIDLEEFEGAEKRFGDSTRQVSKLQKAGRDLRGRYCIGKARDVDWPHDDYVPKITYKIGLCIPESCETISFSRHQRQLERLMLFSMPDYIKPRLTLSDMYCLPDDRSPLRSLSRSGWIFLSLLAIWLTSVIGCTLVYCFYKHHKRDLITISHLQRVHNQNIKQARDDSLAEPHANLIMQVASDKGAQHESGLLKNLWPAKAQGEIIQLPERALEKEDESASFRDQASSRDSSLESSFTDSQARCEPTWIRVAKSMSLYENLADFAKPPAVLRNGNSMRELRVNLNALDAIKCLCCILVILGHIVFIQMQHLTNIFGAIEISHQVKPRLLIAFFNFVDTFFIIGGMLTAYFVFKKYDRHTFSKPIVWLQFMLLRLIRLSPVYVLTFWFVKTISVHLSQGPIWDYGTDKDSMRGLCIRDHWWKTILYLGNVGTMQPICILPAWSIIVDSQYSLIIPPILFLIFKHKRIGYISLIFAIFVSTVKMSLQLMDQTAVKTSDMAKVRLHVYPLISRFAAEFYNSAWNRIGPVAIGIIGGHMLYLYDIKAMRKWPWYMRGAAFKFVLFMHLFILALPTIGRFTDDPESRGEVDVTIFVLSNASIKPIWSIINTILLLRLITDLRSSSKLARLLSHNIWHSMGHLCFASYLIHYEIMMLLFKSRPDGLPLTSWMNALRDFSTVFLISTVIAYFIYILYESPLNKLSSILLEKMRSSQSVAKTNSQVDKGETLSATKHLPAFECPEKTVSEEVSKE